MIAQVTTSSHCHWRKRTEMYLCTESITVFEIKKSPKHFQYHKLKGCIKLNGNSASKRMCLKILLKQV